MHSSTPTYPGGGVHTVHGSPAAGLFNTLRQLGGVFGVALVVAVFTRVGGYASPQQFSEGFSAALQVCAALSMAGAAMGLRLRGRRDRGSTVMNVKGAKP